MSRKLTTYKNPSMLARLMGSTDIQELRTTFTCAMITHHSASPSTKRKWAKRATALDKGSQGGKE